MIRGMPNVPDLPADPAGLASAGIDALISFGGAFVIGLLFGDRWGVFNEFGVPVLLADNVTSVEFQNSANVVSAPLEKGTFTSYNKVQEPYTATVQMTKGSGGATGRGMFIAQLEALSKSTLLFNVLTPEYVHRNAAIVGFGYRRLPSEGNRMIVATIDLKEVREVTVQLEREEPQNPEDSAVVEGGEVEPELGRESLLSSAARSFAYTFTNIRDRGVELIDQVIEGATQ